MFHATLGTDTGAGHRPADMTASLLQRAYGMAPDRARQLAVGGSPDQVASQLAPYVEAGSEVIGVIGDPVPTPRSVELLAEVAWRLRKPPATGRDRALYT